MTRVALLWHMHQPFYQDLRTGEHVLPWVRLHGLKDYWGMVALLREFPNVKLTFNLVPSMLLQLEAFARDEAHDRHLTLGLKPAESLTDAERAYCVDEFFHAHPARMIHPHPRYAELLALRADQAQRRGSHPATAFSVQDLRDLQVWHKLVWVDQLYHEHDGRTRALVEKGRGYNEADKATLREIELEILRRVVPEYRDAADRGQIEIATSPFYHPILPLLCDTDVYLRTHPHSRMPREAFRHPADAQLQLQRAVSYHERLFGRRPVGLWPSEGSVSDAMVQVVAGEGFTWMATDEGILGRTLEVALTRSGEGTLQQADLVYRPYRVGSSTANVACGFRDHALSDAIGFTYASWAPDVAADDFVHRLRGAAHAFRRQTPAGQDATIFVILDGENAWEHFDGQGRPFLRALYQRLSDADDLTTVTMAEACSTASTWLPTIFPGSWINSDFYIWIGHRDDHRAWSQLGDARRALATASSAPEAGRALALEELLVAQGSDWFWWYGDDHNSDHDTVFDDLFRRHVRNVYAAVERPIPDELFRSNITTARSADDREQVAPIIAPRIDGEVSSYFEWLGAVALDFRNTNTAMHQVTDRTDALSGVTVGCDALGNLAIRIDGVRPMSDILGLLNSELTIRFLSPATFSVTLRRTAAGCHVTTSASSDVSTRGAIGDVAEALIPAALLGDGPRTIQFVLDLRSETGAHEHQPSDRPFEIRWTGPRQSSG